MLQFDLIMIRSLFQLNMTAKLVLFLLTVSVIPLMILGLISYRTSRNVIQKDVSNYTLALVIEQKAYLELLLQSVESLIANVSSVEDIKNVLNDETLPTDNYTQLATHAQIGYILNGYLNLKGLVSIDIFTNGGNHYHVGDTLNTENYDHNMLNRIYTEAIKTKRLVLWTGVENNININSTYKKVVTAVKVFHVIDPETFQEKPIALLLVNYSTDSLYDHFSKFDFGEGSYVIIVDTKNRLIYHPTKAMIGHQVSAKFIDQLTQSQGSFITTLENQETLVTYSQSTISDWFVISLVPVANLTTGANTIWNTTMLVLVTCFGFIFLAAVFVSKTTVAPLKDITQLFQEIQAGTFNGEFRFTTKRTDEIGELLRWFNTFLDSLEAKKQADKELIQAKEKAEAANEKILVLNERLEQDNERLEAALNELLMTQRELVQSEKMAALGQLIAGVAHEINTPLGVIRASIGNISEAMNKSIHQLPHLFQELSLEQQQDFLALVKTTLKPQEEISFSEERKLKRSLKKILSTYEIPNSDQVAVNMVMLGLKENNIMSFMSLLQHESNNNILQTAYHLTSQQMHSQNIELAIERASKVVFALKSYAHHDHSGKKLKANVVDGLEVVLTLYHNWIKQGIEVTKKYENVPEIFCYPDELNQVWTNLLHNAIQAMSGKGKLDIQTSKYISNSDEPLQEYVIVEIIDDGPGIPDNIKNRIFEPFFTTKPAGEGSGLGLDIVRRIVNKHEGKIEVASRPGRTAFKVWLPITKILNSEREVMNE